MPEAVPRHKGRQVEVVTNPLNDRFLGRLVLQTLNCTLFHLCPSVVFYHFTTVGHLNQ